MSESEVKKLLSMLTHEEKVKLNEMLKAIEQKRNSKSKNVGEVV